MAFLELSLAGSPLYAWAVAVGIALAINMAVAAVKWVVATRLAEFATRTPSSLDNVLVDMVKGTRQWLVFFVTLFIGAQYLELPPNTGKVLKSAATIAIFLQIGLWLNTLLGFWMARSRQKAMATNAAAATTLQALEYLGRVLVWAMLLLLALENLGVDVTALVAGLGIGGIAVALAVQNILGDLFASLSIVVDKPFVIGDFIIVDDYMGTVEHIGLKTTRIRSLGGEQIIFSNSDLLNARVRNYKRMYERRVAFTFGLQYDTTPDQLERIPGIVRQAVEAQPLTRFDRAHFQKFGDSSLDFEVVYWMKDPDYNKYMDVQQAINLALMRRFAELKVDFAYPTRTLHVEAPIRMEVSSPVPLRGDGQDEKRESRQ